MAGVESVFRFPCLTPGKFNLPVSEQDKRAQIFHSSSAAVSRPQPDTDLSPSPAPGRCRGGPQDALLNVWITAWDGYQLLSDPLHLFDANIFHTYPRTLAYSELLLGNALLALPITAATGNPVLGYNVALLLSFVLSGFGTYLLVLQLTRSSVAGIVAGAIFAFSSYRMTNLAQAQILTTQWLPFALLSLYQLLRKPRLRHVITFVLFFCLQALSSFYYAVLLALTVCGMVVFRVRALDLGAGQTTDIHVNEQRPSRGPWPFIAALSVACGCLLCSYHPALCAALFPGAARAGL